MQTKLGQLRCSFNSKNTGFGSCVEEWKQIAGAFIFDNPQSFTPEQIAALAATLNNAVLNDTKANRAFPVHNFVGFTDSSESVVIETFNYGPKAIVRDGDYDWSFQFTDGANCLQQALRSHNGKRYVLFYDKDNKLLGYNKNGNLATIPLQFFYAHPWKPATGANAAVYMLQFVFLPRYINEDRAFVKAPFELGEIEGLEDLDIIVNTWDSDTGIANITLQKSCGAENLYDEFHTQLANVDNFQAFDDQGEPVTIATIVGVAGSKSFNVTLTDLPDAGTVTLSGSLPSILANNNVEGFEIGSVDLEVPGSI